MKNLKWLALAIAVAVLALPAVASASAIGVLKNVEPPDVNVFHVGDTIDYKITIMCIEDYPLDLFHVWDEFSDPAQNGTLFGPGSVIINPAGTEDYYFSVEVTPAAVYFDAALGTDVVRNDVYAEGVTQYPDFDDPADGHAARRSPILMPEVVVTKTADPLLTKAGHDVTYTITVENTGNCDLDLVSVDDSILGDLSSSFSAALAIGVSETRTFTYTVQEGDPDPLINTVTVTYEDALALAVHDTDFAEVDLIHPGLTLEQVCLTSPVPPGSDAEFGVTIVNTGDVDLIVTTSAVEFPGPFTILAGDTFTDSTFAPCDGDEACSTIDILGVLHADYNLDNQYPASDTDCCPCGETGEEGCTPGYWKNQTECWECYTIDTLIGEVFDVPGAPSEIAGFANDTLLEALRYGGGKGLIGKTRNLLRHAVAALHNGCDPDVAYPMSESGVIDAVNAALATEDPSEIQTLHGTFEMYNEYGCPQDAHCNPIVDGLDDKTKNEERSPGEFLPTQGKDGILPTEVTSLSSPNPFSDSVRISFSLPTSGPVDIDVFDVKGTHVASLVHETRSAGTHEVSWNGRSNTNSPVPAGVYFYKVRFDNDTLLRKMIIMK